MTGTRRHSRLRGHSGGDSDQRVAYLDGLRGWAALVVAVSHGVLALDFALFTGAATDSRSGWDRWLSAGPLAFFATDGNFAVCIFFLLSGYVLSASYMRSHAGWLAFAVRRYVRLGIPIVAGAVFSWLSIVLGLASPASAARITHSTWLTWQVVPHPGLHHLVVSLFRLMFLFQKNRGDIFDSSLWTMPIELSASLLILTVMVAARRIPAAGPKVAGMLFWLMGLLWVGSYFGLFCFGAGLQLTRPTFLFRAVRQQRWLCAMLALAAVALGTVPYSREAIQTYKVAMQFALHFIWRAPFWQHDQQSFWHALGALCLMVLVLSIQPVQDFFSRPVSQVLGRISFPLYIIHVPVLSIVLCWFVVLGGPDGAYAAWQKLPASWRFFPLPCCSRTHLRQ